MMLEYFSTQIRLLTYYRTSLVFEILASGSFIVVNVIFWNAVFSKTDSLYGLSLGSLYLYLIFIESFMVIYAFLFLGYSKLWRRIISGGIDILLLSPRNPFFQIMCESINPSSLIKLVPIFILMVYTVFIQGFELNAFSIFIGGLLVIFSAIVFALIQFSSSTLAFWIGRSTIIDEISDQLTSTQQVPHVVFQTSVKYIIAIAIPLSIGPTNAVIYNEGYSAVVLVWAGLAILFSLVLWSLLAYFLWTNGLKRYHSYGG